ncbi:hypothetical protein ARALYDRAFT_891031 [Arabidopsis lyrata subsp. lyrata]|uniref:Uncharacterized protein n=1 Tax=Arabidopsis lyrata subsp. lyrata TaxID=81972 RepID=D7KK51_ARALL|nr:hypothetical protein ARALYDRAFT_891031 [Arabidopsis lyrata subsp. lyrata]
MEMYPIGSSLPDCSYACGAYSPCKRMMISFQCSVAESCSGHLQMHVQRKILSRAI